MHEGPPFDFLFAYPVTRLVPHSPVEEMAVLVMDRARSIGRNAHVATSCGQRPVRSRRPLASEPPPPMARSRAGPQGVPGTLR